MTGWLQIQSVRPSDEGTYRCLARNALGQVEAPASLTVLTPGKGEPWALGAGGWWWIQALEYVSMCVSGCTHKCGFPTDWNTLIVSLSYSSSFAHMCLQTS